jgi:hypothetical protein
MQKQDSRGVLWTGFAIEDIQVIRTASLVTHWMLLRNELAICCHLSQLVVIDLCLWRGSAQISMNPAVPRGVAFRYRVKMGEEAGIVAQSESLCTVFNWVTNHR